MPEEKPGFLEMAVDLSPERGHCGSLDADGQARPNLAAIPKLERQENFRESEASLGYIANFRLALAT